MVEIIEIIHTHVKTPSFSLSSSNKHHQKVSEKAKVIEQRVHNEYHDSKFQNKSNQNNNRKRCEIPAGDEDRKKRFDHQQKQAKCEEQESNILLFLQHDSVTKESSSSSSSSPTSGSFSSFNNLTRSRMKRKRALQFNLESHVRICASIRIQTYWRGFYVRCLQFPFFLVYSTKLNSDMYDSTIVHPIQILPSPSSSLTPKITILPSSFASSSVNAIVSSPMCPIQQGIVSSSSPDTTTESKSSIYMSSGLPSFTLSSDTRTKYMGEDKKSTETKENPGFHDPSDSHPKEDQNSLPTFGNIPHSTRTRPKNDTSNEIHTVDSTKRGKRIPNVDNRNKMQRSSLSSVGKTIQSTKQQQSTRGKVHYINLQFHDIAPDTNTHQNANKLHPTQDPWGPPTTRPMAAFKPDMTRSSKQVHSEKQQEFHHQGPSTDHSGRQRPHTSYYSNRNIHSKSKGRFASRPTSVSSVSSMPNANPRKSHRVHVTSTTQNIHDGYKKKNHPETTLFANPSTLKSRPKSAAATMERNIQRFLSVREELHSQEKSDDENEDSTFFGRTIGSRSGSITSSLLDEENLPVNPNNQSSSIHKNMNHQSSKKKNHPNNDPMEQKHNTFQQENDKDNTLPSIQCDSSPTGRLNTLLEKLRNLQAAH